MIDRSFNLDLKYDLINFRLIKSFSIEFLMPLVMKEMFDILYVKKLPTTQ